MMAIVIDHRCEKRACWARAIHVSFAGLHSAAYMQIDIEPESDGFVVGAPVHM